MEVMEARNLQIQHKRKKTSETGTGFTVQHGQNMFSCVSVELNQQKLEELAREREEQIRAEEEMKEQDEEQRRRYVVLTAGPDCWSRL